MRFIDGVCKIAMPKKYDAKKAVDSSGNVKHYMKSSQINMIVQARIMAGYGQVQASELGTMGTFSALEDLPDDEKCPVWEEYLQPMITYIFEYASKTDTGTCRYRIQDQKAPVKPWQPNGTLFRCQVQDP